MKKNNSSMHEDQPAQDLKNESRFISFIRKHNTSITLVLVILIILLWAITKISNIQKSAIVEKQQVTEVYEKKLDSLYVSSMELTAQVFSWAIRGEMLRQNMDQVNQYFNRFITEPNVSKIQLIDPISAKIVLSTDKNDEGIIIENTLILQAERTYHISEEELIKVVSPVMGLDSKIGILVIELNN